MVTADSRNIDSYLSLRSLDFLPPGYDEVTQGEEKSLCIFFVNVKTDTSLFPNHMSANAHSHTRVS
jgi:hypothetical protein